MTPNDILKEENARLRRRIADLEDENADLRRAEKAEAQSYVVNTLRRRGAMSPQCAWLAAKLYAAKGKLVSRWALFEGMPGPNGAIPSEDRHPKIVAVIACRTRHRLGQDAIETVWGQGFRMTDIGRAVVDGLRQGLTLGAAIERAHEASQVAA
jgi:DNA-binding response OmpR family regulator